ncbi:DMT family transporter [Pseudomonas sp. KU43P]|uniref:DMT family transporter n=1 Tax=Pseudomonas sp. KU43P TaxID=2487887 RepID=UPI0012AA11BF|nr:DMT family transporter [Pseudomonas sp. KU43P]BBH45424.1 hypothetical protein KU43P_19010 [Pseudomonas sp. KU43P]
MDVTMGLVAAVFWGITDYLVSVNARRFGVSRSVFLGQFLGLVLLSAFVWMSQEGFEFIRIASLAVMLISLAASLLTLTGAIALTKAFKYGKTAIVAPLITLYGVVTALLAWMSGELLSTLQFLGLAGCVLGVILVGAGHKSKSRPVCFGESKAISFALVAAILYGLSFWIQGEYTLPAIGPVNMLWTTYLVGVIFLFPFMLKQHAKNSLGVRSYISLGGAGLFNLGGFTAFSYGAIHGSIAIVTIISTLSGGVAAVLGFIFIKERLSLIQLLGITLVLCGAVMLHIVA